MKKIQIVLKWAKDIFNYNRSLTGEGTKKTLEYFKKINPSLKILSFKSGQKCFDWKVPLEWNIKDAYFVHQKSGKKYSDFKKNNLSVVSYSIPVNKIISKKELLKNLHTLKDQPSAIPYITSYYKKNWGFCLPYKEYKNLKDGDYRVFINSNFKKGKMYYGEILLKGISKKEIVFSSNICHPSMANNELSGPLLSSFLCKELSSKKNYFSYRFLFLPETIGSIAYIKKNLKSLNKNVIAGYVLSCVGDNRSFSYIKSRNGKNLADSSLSAVLKNYKNVYEYSFLERGSDERQYCSPGVDLPFAGFCRTKYGKYDEYHTSLDNLNIINLQGFKGSYEILKTLVDSFETSLFPKVTLLCEPHLSKRNLYPSISKKTEYNNKLIKLRTNLIAYCDGKKNIFEIANIINEPLKEVVDELKILIENGLIKNVKRNN